MEKIQNILFPVITLSWIDDFLFYLKWKVKKESQNLDYILSSYMGYPYLLLLLGDFVFSKRNKATKMQWVLENIRQKHY